MEKQRHIGPARNLKPNKTKSMLNTQRLESERGGQCAESQKTERERCVGKGIRTGFQVEGDFELNYIEPHTIPKAR